MNELLLVPYYKASTISNWHGNDVGASNHADSANKPLLVFDADGDAGLLVGNLRRNFGLVLPYQPVAKVEIASSGCLPSSQ